jgi:hypothetical protein
MLATFVSLNKFIMKIDSIIYLMILLMYYKYYYFLIYIWSRFVKFDFLLNENDK